MATRQGDWGGVSPADFPDVRWKAQWIWVPEEPVLPAAGFAAPFRLDASPTNGLFRRSFTLDAVPDRVPARITADSRYVLYVNGREVGRGPARSQPRRLQYDFYDLAPDLRPGRNVIAVHVRYYGRETAFWTPAVPNKTLGTTGVMAFECLLTGNTWLVSDGSWKAWRTKAWECDCPEERELAAAGVPVEVLDARRLPDGWNSVEFDDESWGWAQVVPAMLTGICKSQPPTHPYGPLYPRNIGHLEGEPASPAAMRWATLPGLQVSQDVAPMENVDCALRALSGGLLPHESVPLRVEVPRGGAVLIEVDMGRIVCGTLRCSFACASGFGFDFSYSEEPLPAKTTFGQMRSGSRYVARGVDDGFTLFDPVGLRYIYLLVYGGAGSVAVEDLVVLERSHPWHQVATFHCSDSRLERIYEACLRTVRLCSQDAFVDCPTREQRAWIGDGVVDLMVTLACNSDWRLAKRYLELADSPRADGLLPMWAVGSVELLGSYTIPDYSLQWLHALYQYYRYSGDPEAVLGWLPTAARILRWFLPYQGAGGVLRDVPEWCLVDWSSVSLDDTSSVLTALWARGLSEFAEMAAWLGEMASQHWAMEVYERVRAGFDVFWDEVRGSYVDHLVDGVPRPEMSQIAGALAIAAGLAPKSRWKSIVQAITDERRLVVRSWSGGGQDEEKFEKLQRGIREIDWDVREEIVRAQPFMAYAVHDAVALAGQAQCLPDLYLRWLDFLSDGYDTIGEIWGGGTHAHGWSCTPARDMVVYTLGVSPAEPGFRSARVVPRLGRLEWVAGTVPTPHGPIDLEITPEMVRIDAPIPFDLGLEGVPEQRFVAGRHTVRNPRQ